MFFIEKKKENYRQKGNYLIQTGRRLALYESDKKNYKKMRRIKQLKV